MITVSLTSGLGNQLFQYFFEKSLELRLGEKQTIKFINDTLTHNHLNLWDIYNLKINWYDDTDKSDKELLYKSHPYLRKYLIKIFHKLRISNKFNIISDEINLDFDNFFQGDFHFYGYWQNYNFFQNYFEQIKKTLVFKRKISLIDILNNKVKKNFDTIVGIHIRGGDYLNILNKKIFSEINSDYYNKNVNYINKVFKKPLFIVFTNDIVYAKKILKNYLKNYFYISELSANPVDDFQYLTQCNHFIIPNSTFSWWAANLSINKDKIIIMPDNWFKTKKDHYSFSKLE